MKILFAQTNYPGFLEEFYRGFDDLDNINYMQIMSRWAEELFGTSNFYSKNLRVYGVDAKEIIMNDWNSQSKWAKENGLSISQIPIPFSKHIPEMVKNTLGLREWIKKITFAQIEDYKPDILYLHDLSIMNSNDIRKLKNIVKLVAGQIACPLPINRDPLKHYGLIISSFPHYVEMFNKQGVNSEYLKWCIDGDIPKLIGKKKRENNVSYVGGLTLSHKTGNRTLEQLATRMNVDFWGYGEGSLSSKSPILKTFHGHAWGRQMYDVFARSKIVINRHIDVAKNYANNMRMFEATGMGALLITDEKKNMEEFFKVDKEVVTYKNPTDLIKKAKYYLNHPKEAAEIAKAGQDRTLREHTYKNRMKELKGIFEKYL